MKIFKQVMACIGFLISQEFIATAMEHDCSYCQGTVGASVHGSTGKWRDNTVPHTDWHCDEVKDLGNPNQVCEMCEVETIRFVHVMSHLDYGSLDVGCICAGHMEEDLAAANARVGQIKTFAQRRARLEQVGWDQAHDGVLNLRTRTSPNDPVAHGVVIQNHHGIYNLTIQNPPFAGVYPTFESARAAALNRIAPQSIVF